MPEENPLHEMHPPSEMDVGPGTLETCEVEGPAGRVRVNVKDLAAYESRGYARVDVEAAAASDEE